MEKINKKVEIYTTPTCAYCKMAKEYFKQKEIEYTEYDVAKDTAKRQEMVDKTQQFGVPVILIDGKVVIGFDKAKINELLGIN
ncbi:MAG: Uxx-star family glutaredoxin-like (seleno)protein [Candidatus Paceibacterota bacterium]